MTPQEAIEILEMFLHKQCDLERTKFAYSENTIWIAVNMAKQALENRIPKKVKNIVIENCIKWGQCPCCNNLVNDCVNNKICNNITCGQALDWLEE